MYANGLGGKALEELASSPQLRIVPAEFGELTISWGSNFTGYTLECSSTLAPGADWNDVPGVVNNSVNVYPDGPSKFYRLRKP